MQLDLPDYDTRGAPSSGKIIWTSNSELIFPEPGGPLDQNKARFMKFNFITGDLATLATSEDTVYDWAWGDEWLFYASESGLWGQDVGRHDPALTIYPVQLSGERFTGLEWP